MKKGSKMSEESKNKMRVAKLGTVGFWKDKKRPDNTPWKGKKRLDITGQNCHFWKGGISKDKEYVSWLKNKRNRMKRSNGGSHTVGEWDNMKAQYNWTCPCCKKIEPDIKLTIDHIIPISLGGSDNIENIQPLCRSCNSKKHDKHIKYE